MKLVSISKSGLATGFYDIKNADAPIEAFEISNILYEVWVDNTDTMKWDKDLEDLVEINITISIEERIQIALTKIDNMSEMARQKIMTIGYGQALVYIEKFEEAADFVAENYPNDLSSYPFIRNESQEFNESSRIVADRILAKKSEWLGKASKIEIARLSGKRLTRTAKSIEEINGIMSATTDRIHKVVN